MKLEEVVLLEEVPSCASGEECNCTHWKPTFRVTALPEKTWLLNLSQQCLVAKKANCKMGYARRNVQYTEELFSSLTWNS